jgi:putative transcriptional regulator
MNSLQGKLLIAAPQMDDPNFARSVLLMIQHDEEGAMGLILNRPLETTLQEALDQSGEEEAAGSDAPNLPLHQGGPCEGPLMVVHTHASVSQVEVMEGVHFSTERPNVEWLLENNQGPIKFFLGYAGWSPGQLEAEIEAGGWLTAAATAESVFADGENQWQRLHAQLTLGRGLNPRIIPIDPRLN